MTIPRVYASTRVGPVGWRLAVGHGIDTPARPNRSRARTEVVMIANEPVVVARYPFRTAAEAARLRLEAEGIPASLLDAEVVDMNWFLAEAIGWIKVMVPAADAERAATILRETEERRLTRRWRRPPRVSQRPGDTTMADQDGVDPDQIDDLERQIYGLRLHVATVYRLLTSKGVCNPEGIKAVMEQIDASDGARDDEFFGDVLDPGSDQP